MASPWRRFAFFDKGDRRSLIHSLHKPSSSGGASPPQVQSDTFVYAPRSGPLTRALDALNDDAINSEEGVLLVGDAAGAVHVLDENVSLLWSFRAFRGATHIACIPPTRGGGSPLLVCVGVDTPGVGDAEAPSAAPAGASNAKDPSAYTLKIWDLCALLAAVAGAGARIRGGGDDFAPLPEPRALRTIQITPGARVTAAAASTGASRVALGFADGSVTVYRGDLANPGFTLKARNTTQMQIKAPRGGRPAPVTSLTFGEIPGNGANVYDTVRLFITTALRDEMETGICTVFDASDLHGAHLQEMVLDETRGCARHCATYDSVDNLFMVGRDDGVYSFTAEHFFEAGAAGAAAFEGRKQMLSMISGSNPGRQPGYVLVASHNEKSSRIEINFYDLKNKFVAFNHRLDPDQRVETTTTGLGTVFILTSNMSVLRVREKNTNDKLALLYSMKYYPQAIMLAKSASFSDERVSHIYRMYGDHKYKKCDWDGAIAQYCHTIGFTEPSYVIKQFLDPQRIQNLTTYLEHLHSEDQGVHANKDHTTLLLNCYTKLKDVDKLNRFISKDMGNFDVETAIQVLRSAGYTQHALELARKTPHERQHEWYLQIQLERHMPDSSPDYDDALNFMGQLTLRQVEDMMKRYGKVLMTNAPDKTTGLLMKMCTGEYGEDTTAGVGGPGKVKSRPEEFIQLFADNPTCLQTFLEHVFQKEDKVSSSVANTLLELQLRDWSETRERLKSQQNASASDRFASTMMAHDPLSSPSHAVAVAHSSPAQPPDAGVADIELKVSIEMKRNAIMALLKAHERAPYDKYHALVLIQLYDFKEGQPFLYKYISRGSSAADLGGVVTDLLVEQHLSAGNYTDIFQVCKENSKSEAKPNPELWTKVLTHLVLRCEVAEGIPEKCEDEESLEEAHDLLMEFLEEIEMDKILPPFQVMQVLSTNPKLPFSVAKRYLSKFMRESQTVISEHRREIRSLHISTSQMQRRIGELGLRSSATTDDQSRVGPGSHNAAVFSETNKYQQIKHSMSKGAADTDNEARFAELEQSTDGFSTVAKFFGQGMVR